MMELEQHLYNTYRIRYILESFQNTEQLATQEADQSYNVYFVYFLQCLFLMHIGN